MLFSIAINAQKSTKECIRIIGELIHKTLDKSNSVYIEDSIVYNRLLTELELHETQAVSSFCYNELLKYGDIELLKKYIGNFDIDWMKYPYLYALISDTVKIKDEFPLWLKATLGDVETISQLLYDFENEHNFSEKIRILNCLLRVKDKRVLNILLKECQKNCYYHCKENYAYFNSKYFLFYWLHYVCNKETIFRENWNKYINNYHVYYYKEDLSNGPNILNLDKNIKAFIDSETSKNIHHIEYVREVEDYIERNFCVSIESKQIGIMFFYYFVEIE
jgi:hypothetical protein